MGLLARGAVGKIAGPAIFRPSSLGRDALRHLLRNRSAQLGLLLLGFLLLVAIFAPWIATHDHIEYRDPSNRVRTPPCIHLFGCPASEPQHLFGLDGNGRDLFSRVIYATRVSLFIGVATVTFAIIVGTLLGAISGAQTFTAGLAALQEKSDSPVAVIGYSGAVPIAHVVLTTWGTVIVLLMS